MTRLIGQPKVVVLDCRFYLTDHKKGQLEYQEGHIPGAIFVDVHHELSSAETEFSGRHPLPDENVFSTQLQAWGIEQDSIVVVYDASSGSIAGRAWWMLSQQGIDVRVLNGGFPAWLSEGGDVSCEVNVPVVASMRFEVSFPWSVSEQAVAENLETDQFQLVDARSAGRFRGENETIDPVGGHIPGAVNRPFTDNLNANGYFKEANVLHDEWQSCLSESHHEDRVYYCGSGISACHNILALNHAGIPAKRLYIGSWSQWSKRMLRAASF
nr:sulfurtransferase [Marinomonas algarum]